MRSFFLTTRWHVRAAKAKLWPSKAEEDYVALVGWWWLLLHGVKFQYTIRTTRHKYRVDFAKPKGRKRKYGKVLEIDSKGYHKDHIADWERDRDLFDHGYEVMRITKQEMGRYPRDVRAKSKRFFRY